MRTILPLTERTAEGPAAVPAPVDQPWQPFVAGQAHWLGIVVWTNCSRNIIEQDLPSRYVPGCHEKTPTPLLMENGVWKTLVVVIVSILHLAGCGAVDSYGAGGASQRGFLLRTHNTGSMAYAHYSYTVTRGWLQHFLLVFHSYIQELLSQTNTPYK